MLLFEPLRQSHTDLARFFQFILKVENQDLSLAFELCLEGLFSLDQT